MEPHVLEGVTVHFFDDQSPDDSCQDTREREGRMEIGPVNSAKILTAASWTTNFIMFFCREYRRITVVLFLQVSDCLSQEPGVWLDARPIFVFIIFTAILAQEIFRIAHVLVGLTDSDSSGSDGSD